MELTNLKWLRLFRITLVFLGVRFGATL